MVMAKKSYTANNYLEDRVESRPNSRKKDNNKSKTVKVKLLSLILVCFVMGLCFIAGTAIEVMKNNQINALEKEIENLKTTNQRLFLQKSQLNSLDRIEKIATKELNMKKPDVENVKMLSKKKNGENLEVNMTAFKNTSPNNSGQEKEKSESNIKSKPRINPYVAAISSLVANLFLTN